jgi:hypothetical protein
MIRQLARLTRRVPAAGRRAVAFAVYANDEDRGLAARDRGFEGVACVDDAARGVVLLLDLYRDTGDRRLGEWAAGLVDFVLYMQREDGRFHNFIRDWDGNINTDGPTSYPGGTFWQARAVRALAKAHLVLRDPRFAEPLARGFAFATQNSAPPDVRTIQVLAALDLMRVGLTPVLREMLERWCDEIADCREGDVLLNSPAETAPPHLWGHVHEGVLAEAAPVLDRPDLLDLARQSAHALLVPHVELAFPERTVQPYGVAAAVYAMDRLYNATGEAAYGRWRDQARAWFDGRNAASQPVYDRVNGRVLDGIDDGRLNQHSGAEANIVGAQALLPDVSTRVGAMLDEVADRLEVEAA